MSDSVRSHRQQPTRLPRLWDSPGKSTGVGCHFLLQYMKVKSESEVAQSCPTLHDPMDGSLPGSSVHGIFQARVLVWGAIAFLLTLLLITNLSSCLFFSSCSMSLFLWLLLFFSVILVFSTLSMICFALVFFIFIFLWSLLNFLDMWIFSLSKFGKILCIFHLNLFFMSQPSLSPDLLGTSITLILGFLNLSYRSLMLPIHFFDSVFYPIIIKRYLLLCNQIH